MVTELPFSSKLNEKTELLCLGKVSTTIALNMRLCECLNYCMRYEVPQEKIIIG